jgi:hypothetical protein
LRFCLFRDCGKYFAVEVIASCLDPEHSTADAHAHLRNPSTYIFPQPILNIYSHLFQCINQRAKADPRGHPIRVPKVRPPPHQTVRPQAGEERRYSDSGHSHWRTSRARAERTEIDKLTAPGPTQADEQHEARIQLLLWQRPARARAVSAHSSGYHNGHRGTEQGRRDAAREWHRHPARDAPRGRDPRR